MKKSQNTISLLSVWAIMFGLFAAPALAVSASKSEPRVNGSAAGFVLMVSLQRHAG